MVRGERAHGELLVAGRPDLAHHQHVHRAFTCRRRDGVGDLAGDRNPAARESQDDRFCCTGLRNAGAVPDFDDPRTQQPTRLAAVGEDAGAHEQASDLHCGTDLQCEARHVGEPDGGLVRAVVTSTADPPSVCGAAVGVVVERRPDEHEGELGDDDPVL